MKADISQADALQPEHCAHRGPAHPKIAAFAGYRWWSTLIGGTSVFLRRLMLIAAVAGPIVAQADAAESQSTPGVSDTQIKIGQTIAYSGPASSFATRSTPPRPTTTRSSRCG
jgi:hypothetical protein